MNTLSSQCQYPSVRSNSQDSNRGPDHPSRAENTGRMPRNLHQLTPKQRLQVYREVLESNRPFLCGHLDPSRHYAYLRSKRFFDRSTVELIDSKVTTDEKVNCFIDELLEGGPDAVSSFIESLEKNRVEQFVFSTLADQLQSFRIEDLPLAPNTHSRVGNQEKFDIHDERASEGGFNSLSSTDGMGVVNGNVPVLPAIDINRLREAEGKHLPEEDRNDPEECSDISSQDGLTSHAP